MPQAENVAIFLPTWVGDTVMATPALGALRRHFADAQITHIGRPTVLALLAGGELADHTMPDRSRQWPMPISFLRQARRIARRRFDLVVLLPNSFRTALLCRLGKVKRIAGYDRDGRGWLLTDRLAPPTDDAGNLLPVSAIDYYNGLARMLGAAAESRRMFLPAVDGAPAGADLPGGVAIDGAGPVVMLNPGGAFGPSKLWPAERYAKVADALMQLCGAQIIINAAPGEGHLAAEVARCMRERPAINFADCDNTIALLKRLLTISSLLITNDTGVRHMAAAAGIGVVTIFGSTDPQRARIDYRRERIVRAEVPCGPCQKKRCPLPAGPDHHQCMTAVTVEMVLAAAKSLLDQPSNERTEGDR